VTLELVDAPGSEESVLVGEKSDALIDGEAGLPSFGLKF